MKIQTTRYQRAMGGLRKAALILSAFSLGTSGCDLSAPPPDSSQQEEDSSSSATFSIGARDIEGLFLPPQGRSLSSLSFSPSSLRSSLAFSYADVSRLLIDVKEKDSGNILFVNFDLFLSAGEWTGTLPFLPKAKALTFSAKALNSSGSTLFSGTTDQTLSINHEKVIIALAPSNDGQTITLPRIKKISIPTAFGSDQSANVSFSVEANTGEKLTYTIAPATGGGTFYPVTGSITLAATAGTFVSQYAPPTVTVETDFEHTVKVTNEAGHSITTTFKTKVKPPGKTDGVKDSVINVLFNPVINHITANRVLDTGNVIWKADVADDGAQEALSYSWSFTPDGTFDPVPAFTGNTNPSTLQNYTTQVQGRLKLAVTDGNGGVTTLYYQLTPDQFPDKPSEVGALTGFNSIRAGSSHTCILFNNGNMRCWGRSNSGQLGYANTFTIGDNELPHTAGDIALVGVGTKIATGAEHTCALLDSGYVRCWGNNQYGQLGYNTTQNVGDGEAISSYGYVNLGGNVAKLTAGYWHTCALMDTGKVRCWGHNANYELGYNHTNFIGDNELPSTAGDVNLGGTALQLTAGSNHTCALLDTGYMRCWGSNYYGQLGYGHNNNASVPANLGDVNTGDKVLQAAAGELHTCALLSTGDIKCWGYPSHGALGYGNTSHHYAPPTATVNLGGATAYQVETGAYHTCALLSTGAARCWGYNGYGQLGYGHVSNIGDNEQPSTAGDIQVLRP